MDRLKSQFRPFHRGKQFMNLKSLVRRALYAAVVVLVVTNAFAWAIADAMA